MKNILIYTFHFVTKGAVGGQGGVQHECLEVDVPRPDNWPDATRQERRAVERLAVEHLAVETMLGAGWTLSRLERPWCECRTPRTGTGGACGNCGGADAPLDPPPPGLRRRR